MKEDNAVKFLKKMLSLSKASFHSRLALNFQSLSDAVIPAHRLSRCAEVLALRIPPFAFCTRNPAISIPSSRLDPAKSAGMPVRHVVCI